MKNASVAGRTSWVALAVVTVIVTGAGFVDGWTQPRLLAGEPVADVAAAFSVSLHLAIAIGLVAPFVFFVGVAGFVVWRRPEDRTALLFGVMLITNGAIMSRATQVAFATRPWTQPLALGIWLLGAVSVALFLITFPDGRVRQRWALVAPLGAVLGWLAYPRGVEAILYLPELPAAAGRFQVAAALGMVMFVAGVSSQVDRYRRRASPLHRQQIKWAVFPLLLLLVVGTAGGVAIIVGASARVFGAVLVAMMAITLLMPVAWAKAILRDGLYEIDRIISRTLAYAIVVGLLGTGYAALVLGLQAVLAGFAGGSELAVAGSTLAAAAAFRPLRDRAKRVVDRQFNRSAYDARVAVESFARRLRDEVDLEAIRDDLVRTAASTVQPTRVSAWFTHPEGAPNTRPVAQPSSSG